MKRVSILLPLLLCFPIVAVSQRSSALNVTQEEISAQLKLVTCKNDERLGAVKGLFGKVGAKDEDINIEKFNDAVNMTLVKKGKSDETIVIGAHYDKVDLGCGAIDNWTGIVILANLYAKMKDLQTQKTYLFVAFGNEEKGLFGSRAMAKSIPKEKRSQYCSMVNFDSFGFGYPHMMANASNPKMLKFAGALAEEVNMPFYKGVIDGDADSHSFLSNGIPAITLDGLSARWKDYLHTSSDKIENVNAESVFVGFNFGYLLLSRLDQGACEMFRK